MLVQKLGCRVKLWKNLVYTLEGTVLIHSSWNFVKMLIVIISPFSLKLVHVASTFKSLGQIKKKKEKLYTHSFDAKFMKFCQKVNSHNI